MDVRATAALAVTLGAATLGVVTNIRMQAFLHRRGRELNPLLMRLLLYDYVSEYRRITGVELGRPGILFTHFTSARILALSAALYAVLILRLT